MLLFLITSAWLCWLPVNCNDDVNRTATAEEKVDRSEFIRTDCQKTNITVYIPKWTVDRSSPDLVRFDSSSCMSKEYNKTHYFLFTDLINPKKDCSTRRNSEA